MTLLTSEYMGWNERISYVHCRVGPRRTAEELRAQSDDGQIPISQCRGSSSGCSRDDEQLVLSHLFHLSHISLFSVMGNDGGSIPDRRDLVRSKPKVNLLTHHFSLHIQLLSTRPSRQTKPIN